MGTQAPLLRLEGLSKQYPSTEGATPLYILKEVTLDIAQGEAVARALEDEVPVRVVFHGGGDVDRGGPGVTAVIAFHEDVLAGVGGVGARSGAVVAVVAEGPEGGGQKGEA